MAGFSNHQDNSGMNPFLLDLVYLQNHPMAMKMIMPGFMEDHGSNMALNTSCFSQFYPPETGPNVEGTAPATIVHESSCVDHSSKVALSDDNEPSVTKQQSSESSTVVDKLESGEQVTQKLITPIDKKRKTRNGSSPNSAQSKEAREEKGKKQKQCIGEAKVKQPKPKGDKKDQKKTDQEPPTGYIHVRARRGQATDSHSLAERVRREKISERMKVLQKLVPGCDRVTGKALMLDEIINYVQSLQDQVEFLSMKIASANPMFYDFGMDQDSFIFRPSERLYFQTSPVPQCSPNQATVFADTQTPAITTTTTAPNNSYTLMDTSASISLHGQSQRPSTFSQDNTTLLWDVEEQGQKFLNPSGFNDNLHSFN